jgi:Carboxypeptidase regulatory-like domain
MLPGTLLLTLLTASLLATPSSPPPKLPDVDPVSEGIQYSNSIVSPPTSDDAKYTLRGTVVSSLTGEPIRGALVQIYLNGQSSTLTGPDGKFQFDGLPAGQTSITVRKPGFFAESDFQPDVRTQLLATTGPNNSPLILKLIPEGVIYGRISEEDGEPIEGLPVALLVQSLQNGRKTWQQRPAAVTDEDGNFRFAELPPGNYFLSAGPSRDPVTFPAKLSQPGAQGIPQVYYPVGSELAAAAPISIPPGRKAEINLTLSPQPFYRVSGTISGYTPTQQVVLQLRNSAGIPLAYNSRFDSASGTFRILWVPAGAYTLQADAPDSHGHSLTASVPLTVSADLSGVHVLLLPTVNIRVQMTVISSRTGPERFSEQENYFPAYVQLVSHNAGLFELRYGSQQVGERGASSLEVQNIAPGTYRVEVNPNGPLYVQSALSGTTDLLESDLSVAPGASPQPIEITLRDDVASVSGTVSSDNQALSATILAFSEHAAAPPRIQPTDQGGGFQLSFLPPGAYKILAVDHPDRLEYANPETLRKYLSKAREVTLSPDQSAKIDLELAKVGE